MLSSFGLGLALLIGSVFLSLRHVIPIMYSGRSQRTNPRTVIGTEAYRSNQAYTDEIMSLTLESMIALDADQIRGMNKNIMRNQRAIRIAVRLTMAALIPLVVLVVLFALRQGP